MQLRPHFIEEYKKSYTLANLAKMIAYNSSDLERYIRDKKTAPDHMQPAYESAIFNAQRKNMELQAALPAVPSPSIPEIVVNSGVISEEIAPTEQKHVGGQAVPRPIDVLRG